MNNLLKTLLSESRILNPNITQLVPFIDKLNAVNGTAYCFDQLGGIHYVGSVLKTALCSQQVFEWDDGTYCLLFGSDKAMESITSEATMLSYFLASAKNKPIVVLFVQDDGNLCVESDFE